MLLPCLHSNRSTICCQILIEKLINDPSLKKKGFLLTIGSPEATVPEENECLFISVRPAVIARTVFSVFMPVSKLKTEEDSRIYFISQRIRPLQ